MHTQQFLYSRMIIALHLYLQRVYCGCCERCEEECITWPSSFKRLFEQGEDARDLVGDDTRDFDFCSLRGGEVAPNATQYAGSEVHSNFGVPFTARRLIPMMQPRQQLPLSTDTQLWLTAYTFGTQSP